MNFEIPWPNPKDLNPRLSASSWPQCPFVCTPSIYGCKIIALEKYYDYNFVFLNKDIFDPMSCQTALRFKVSSSVVMCKPSHGWLLMFCVSAFPTIYLRLLQSERSPDHVLHKSQTYLPITSNVISAGPCHHILTKGGQLDVTYSYLPPIHSSPSFFLDRMQWDQIWRHFATLGTISNDYGIV